jgi:ATP-dependent DNA helicase RecG
MILQYVERYGRITRREAAGLCQITERQATYLLGKMVKSGKLKAEGKKRGTRYIMS